MLDFFRHLAESGGYGGIFLIAFLESSFNPFPSELIFPFIGFIAASSSALALWGAILAGAIGATAGATFLYLIGFVLGRANLKFYVDRWGKFLKITFSDIEKAERWFEKYEESAVFFGRMIPVVRTLVSLPAGFVAMDKIKFGIYTFLGSFLWIGILTVAGYYLGKRWEEIVPFLRSYSLILGLGLTLVGAFLLIKFIWAKSAAQE